jgi:hypothetical protein
MVSVETRREKCMKFAWALAATLALTPAASAQTVEALEAAEAATQAAWEQLPLTERTVTFVETSSTGYGIYDARETNVFKPGEPIISYVEPIGFGWKPIEGDKFEMGFAIDLVLKAEDGRVISDQKGYMQVKQESHERNREYSIDMALTFDNPAPGKYSVTYTIHDTSSDEQSSFVQAFEISE